MNSKTDVYKCRICGKDLNKKEDEQVFHGRCDEHLSVFSDAELTQHIYQHASMSLQNRFYDIDHGEAIEFDKADYGLLEKYDGSKPLVVLYKGERMPFETLAMILKIKGKKCTSATLLFPDTVEYFGCIEQELSYSMYVSWLSTFYRIKPSGAAGFIVPVSYEVYMAVVIAATKKKLAS